MIFLKKNYQPLFSIIVTTYNRAELIIRALDSLLAQDEKDWECIIIDDGSSDKTYEIGINYCNNDDRFRYTFSKNKGQASAKNFGVLCSTGFYTSFLDSDDEYKSNHLSSRKELLNANPDIDLLHGGFEIIGDKLVPDSENPRKMIHLNDCIIGGTFFIKTKKIKEIGGFDLVNYADDTDFYKKVKNNKLLVAKTNIESYIYHRDHDESLTKNYE